MSLNNKIGILGGSFDPAHKGHLAISKEAKKKFKLKKIIWAINNKNPFKKKSHTSIIKRIHKCKKFTKSYRFIEIKFFEKIIRSNKTIDLINRNGFYEYYSSKNGKAMGAYNFSWTAALYLDLVLNKN